MKCPNCSETLVMSDRNGVEIDYCPKCRGVWLDRGELDKIIERSESQSPAPNKDHSDHRPDNDDRKYKEDDRKYKEDEYKYKKKKRDSFLGDLFDF
jgi:Zn-finger nucleic acid-binding protein